MTIQQRIEEIQDTLSNFPNINNFQVNLVPISNDSIKFEMTSKSNKPDIPEKKMFSNKDFFFCKKKVININEDFKIEM